VGIVVAVFAIVLIGLFTYRTLSSREAAANRVTATLQLIESLEAVQSVVKDAETGQRGYLLSGEERYLDPYMAARASVADQMARLQAHLSGDPEQQQRFTTLQQAIAEKLQELDQTIAKYRTGDVGGALGIVKTDRGKATMDRVRELVASMETAARTQLAMRQEEWQAAVGDSFRVTFGGLGVLLLLIAAAAVLMSSDFRSVETQAWLRAGQMGLSARIQGEQRLETLGESVLGYVADFLDAPVGAVYFLDSGEELRRCAGYALPAGYGNAVVKLGDSLVGQAARERRVLHITNVPAGYLSVASGVGTSAPSELVLAPAMVDGVVHGVLELGFFRRVGADDLELLNRVSELLGVAVRSSKDRSRLEELLEATQRQAGELQTQQEELRVTNEELEEQGRALKESQLRMETQQVELEQINSQLEEQTQILEEQKNALSAAQVTLTSKAVELERANQYKNEFLANMSHELRTPLNSLLILAKVLADNKDGNLTPDQVRFAQTISSAGNDLLTLINDILDLSKIEAGKVDVSPEPVATSRIVDELLAPFRAVAEEQGLRFTATIEPDTPATLDTDPQRVAQILRNLLSNAFKFTEKGQVSLRVFPAPDDSISFAVRDTGIGIPADQQSVVFEAFRQADGSTHRKYGGTGLGLSISRDLAGLLGGSIDVQSMPGEGSTFTLTLPRAYDARTVPLPAPAALQARPEQRPSQAESPVVAAGVSATVPTLKHDAHGAPARNSRLILVVEDDVRFAEILRDLAHELGFECILAHTANDGFAAAKAHHPRAIVLDVKLPDHSGLGVLDQLKRTPETRHIPVHVVSVEDYSKEALERGAIGYALKPVKRDQLVEAFRTLEAKSSQRLRRVLVVEDDERQRASIRQLLESGDVEITAVPSGAEALSALRMTTFDCMVMDLHLPDLSGYDLLEKMAEQDGVAFPPVIVYTGRSLTADEEQRLRRFSKSIIIKDARSPERLLDEVTLFLHQVESELPLERQRMLRAARDRDATLDGRRVLVVEDDVRNVFALSSVLEPKGVKVEIARNGREAIDVLTRQGTERGRGIDLVLMDIMMPEMDGLTSMREIRLRPEWKKLPVIALTAKAMKDDQEKCMAAGANDYIAKPLDVEKLLSLVRVWMPK
jgi:signal transduction histidine kinase/DNA-binding response OmpR family regulator/CHASE3 domain sensor protein